MRDSFAKRPSTTVKKVSSSRAHGDSDAAMKMNNTFQSSVNKEKENSQTRKRMAMNSANNTNNNINFMN
jgi:hypothetical protein